MTIYPIQIVMIRQRLQMGQRRPLGDVVFGAHTKAEEHIVVPYAVASSFRRKLDTNTLCPQSRSEALQALSTISHACALARVTRLLNRRDYAVAEIRRKLALDGYERAVVDDVVRRALRGGALDDIRFADSYIHSKIQAGWGSRRIERELSLKGIELAQVPGWPDEYLEEDSEANRAYMIASRRHLSGNKDYAKLVRFLLGRGFSISDASAASSRVLAKEGKPTKLAQ